MFFRVKNLRIRGKTYSYCYLVENKWNKDKKQSNQKVILYLGRVHNLTPYITKEVFERDGTKCLCCGRMYGLTVSHIKPLSNGGTNEKENLQVICETCNRRKGNMEIDYRVKIEKVAVEDDFYY